MIVSHSVRLRMRNVSGKSCRENQHTFSLFNNFFSENHALYKIIQGGPKVGIQYATYCIPIFDPPCIKKTMVHSDRRQMTL